MFKIASLSVLEMGAFIIIKKVFLLYSNQSTTIIPKTASVPVLKVGCFHYASNGA